MCDEGVKLEDTCLVCNKVLTNGATCTDHDEKVRQYECLYCDLNFSRQASLVWHLKTVHDYKLNRNVKKSPSGSEHNYYERPKCSKCHVELLNAYELEKHTCGSSEPESPKVEQPTQESTLESSVNKVKNESSTQPSKVKKQVESPLRQPSRVKNPIESPIKEPVKVKKEPSETNKIKKPVESPIKEPVKVKKEPSETNKVKKPVESPVAEPSKSKEAAESPVTQTSRAKKPVKLPGTECNKVKEDAESADVHCSNCNKDFASQDEYHKHLSKYATRYRPFFCCICQTTFSRKRSLIFHLYIHKRSSEPESKVSRLSDIAAPPRAFPYIHPSKKPPPKKVVHMKTPARKSKKGGDTDGPARKSARISTEKRKQKPRKPVPKDKPQVIDVRNNDESNQKCTLCQKKFEKVLELETHMIKDHQAPLMHKCFLCPEAFVLRPSLLNHAICHIF